MPTKTQSTVAGRSSGTLGRMLRSAFRVPFGSEARIVVFSFVAKPTDPTHLEASFPLALSGRSADNRDIEPEEGTRVLTGHGPLGGTSESSLVR